MEFCSKWFFYNGGVLQATRDYTKLLLTNNFYNKSNQHILNNPALHSMAILEGLKAERASRFLEDLILCRTQSAILDRSLIDKYLAKKASYLGLDPTDYQLERAINSRLGLSWLDLFRAMTDTVLMRGQFVKMSNTSAPHRTITVVQPNKNPSQVVTVKKKTRNKKHRVWQSARQT